MSCDDYYPPGTYACDPRAPWNDMDDEREDEEEEETAEDDEEDAE